MLIDDLFAQQMRADGKQKGVIQVLVNSWLLGKRCCIIEQLPF